MFRFLRKCAVVSLLVVGIARVGRAEEKIVIAPEDEGKSYSAGAGRRIPIGAYGEVHAMIDEDKERSINLKRMVVFLGYDFGKKIRFFSEVEFEGELDKTTGKRLEVSVEQAFLEWELLPELALRAGLVLVPLGIINAFHEPPTFHGVDRPRLDKVIIPTTWRELGFGLFGNLGAGFRYQAYLTAGLDGSKFDGENGIRKGRQGEGDVNLRDIAASARIEWAGPLGLTLGLGGYYGTVAQNDARLSHVKLGILEADAMFKRSGLELRGVYALSWLKNAHEINDAYSLTGTKALGERAYAAYVEAAYNVLGLLVDTEHELFPFVRWEILNTQEQPAQTSPQTSATAKQYFNFGLTYRPLSRVVFKVDATKQTDRDGNWAVFLGAGFMY